LTELQDQLATETTMKNLFKSDAAEKEIELSQVQGKIDMDRSNKDKLIAHWRQQVDTEQQARRAADQERAALERDKLNLDHQLKELVCSLITILTYPTFCSETVSQQGNADEGECAEICECVRARTHTLQNSVSVDRERE
jgi:hypothetical protein